MDELVLVQPKGWRRWISLYRLYRSAFPAAERKPFWMIRSMYRKGKTDIWCVERGGSFLGLGITINSQDLILLDYFAVVGTHRCEGVGSKALAALMEQYAGKGFFLEIECVEGAGDMAPLRQRRKRFYLKAGLQELGVRVKLFGVDMELLGVRCQIDYERYKTFYAENYNAWAARHIGPGGVG